MLKHILLAVNQIPCSIRNVLFRKKVPELFTTMGVKRMNSEKFNNLIRKCTRFVFGPKAKDTCSCDGEVDHEACVVQD